ncbi:MAG: DinB family protein [Calditrichia bacterium]
MNENSEVRQHVLRLLQGKGAHIDFDEAVKNLRPDLRGERREGFPYTIWQLLEHIRIAQWDMVEFSKDANHQSPEWPKEYWPEEEAPPDDAAWENSLRQIQADRIKMEKMVEDQQNDLLAKIPHGSGQTLLREALQVADHNAYHLGQIMLMRKILENDQGNIVKIK